jgi:hypothetical protein
MAGMNCGVVLGTISKYGITHSDHDGTPVASLTLAVTERWGDEDESVQYIPLEVRGRETQKLTDAGPGTLLLASGRWARRQRKSGWETVMAVRELDVLPTPVGVA